MHVQMFAHDVQAPPMHAGERQKAQPPWPQRQTEHDQRPRGAQRAATPPAPRITRSATRALLAAQDPAASKASVFHLK